MIIESNVLQNIISSTIFASGNDDLRPVMSGVFFQINSEKSCFVATDAHKLVKYTRNDVKSSSPLEFIVPNKPLNVLKNILDDNKSSVKIDYNTSNAIFKFSNYKLVCRLIWKIPNYDAVIPSKKIQMFYLKLIEVNYYKQQKSQYFFK